MSVSSPFSFTSQQRRTLEAAADRIVPADKTCGAAEAGALDFVCRLLNQELCREQQNYIHGLNGIDQEASAIHGKAFADLSPTQQDLLLGEIEADRVKTAWITPPRDFFQMLVEHVLESFYADPGNGGNRDAVSWKMMGYRAEGGNW